MRRAVRAVVGLALLTTVSVACGDDDDDETETTSAASVTTAAAAGTTAASAGTTAAAATTTATSATEASAAPTGSGAGSESEGASGSEFVIEEFEFPDDFVATAGETFTVTNADDSPHTVTSDEFDVRVDGGAEGSLTIDAPGTYDIVCKIHPSMSGTITVE